MTGEPLHDFCKKKAFEVSYALFRVARAAPSRKSFSEHIEAQALDLLRSAAARDYRSTTATLAAIEYFLRLGVEGGLVSPSNTQLIINEANNLNAAMIAAFGNAATVAELNLEDVFSSNIADESLSHPLKNEKLYKWEKDEKSEENMEETMLNQGENDEEKEGMEIPPPEEGYFLGQDETVIEVADAAIDEKARKLEPSNNAAIVAEYVTKMRQSTILERVKEFDSCRLRDIQEVFPDISERTIRYDLQSLVEQGLIERIGSGGPGSYYRAKRAYSPQTA